MLSQSTLLFSGKQNGKDEAEKEYGLSSVCLFSLPGRVHILLLKGKERQTEEESKIEKQSK